MLLSAFLCGRLPSVAFNVWLHSLMITISAFLDFGKG